MIKLSESSTRWDTLERKGYKFYSFEYDYDAQREQKRLLNDYSDVKLVRERTDTKGLKMYSIWVKE